MKIDHPYYLTEATMTAYLRRAGFDIVRTDYAADHLHVSYVARPCAARCRRRCRPQERARAVARGAVRAERTASVTASGVLALVPARGGSKGIHDKNIRPLPGERCSNMRRGRPSASGVIDRMVLSTDSERIAAEGRRVGLEVPFMRPAELAQDDTPMLPVIEHAVELLEQSGWSPEIIVLLQPTSPLRTPDHIRHAVRAAARFRRRFRRHRRRAAAAPVSRLRDADRRRAAGAVSAARVRA